MARLENEARQERRGLWNLSAPVPPWDWRKGQGRAAAAGVIGNRRSHVNHLAHCPAPSSMKAANRVTFARALDAQAAGYRPARNCRVDGNGD
jgi:Metal binding domain of Ada